jgi:hypothetical protein
MNHRQHFGFKSEPFAKDIATKDLLKLASMIGVKERLDYCLNLGCEILSNLVDRDYWLTAIFSPS